MTTSWYGLGHDGRNASGDRLSIGRAHVAYLAAWQHGERHYDRRPTLWERPSMSRARRLLAAVIGVVGLAVLVTLLTLVTRRWW